MSNFKEILNHGKNYLLANLANRALAFVSIPVYTNLLTSEEYGIYAVFMSYLGILGSVLTFSVDGAVGRYYFSKKSDTDFRQFVGTSSLLAILIGGVNSLVLLILSPYVAKLVGLPLPVVWMLIPMTFINVWGLTFEQIFGVMKQSKILATTSLVRIWGGFVLSAVGILLMSTDKYYGQILGQIVIGIALCFYWGKRIKPYFEFSFRRDFVYFILRYSIPRMPYALSGILIEQFAKVTIGAEQGMADAGFYTLALTIAALTGISITIAHQAWNPYYYEYMNARDYVQHDKDQLRIFRLTIIVAFVIAAFGENIGMILANRNFYGSFYLIPIFVVGYMFYQLAYVYMRNFGYAIKTGYLSVVVFVAGAANIAMNLYTIPRWGQTGAAISFSVSYIIMTAIAWGINRWIIKVHGTALRKFMRIILISVPIYAPLFFVNRIENLWLNLTTKFGIVALACFVLLYSERHVIAEFIKNYLPNRRK